MSKQNKIVPANNIRSMVHLVRGQKVMLDSDLADLYGTETRILIQAVKRNLDRFPKDFMFQLSNEELNILRSQFVISKSFAGRRYPPYAFTEQGVAMLSSVLKSKPAIQVNITIMRTFVQLRRILASNEELGRRLNELEKKYDAQFRVVFDAIRELMTPPAKDRKQIGFKIS